MKTPLGNILADEELGAELKTAMAGSQVYGLTPDRFPDDNTLELQFPFIRYLFPNAKILAVGIAPPLAEMAGEAAVTVAEKLRRKIRVVGSTDMTHYGPRFGMTPTGEGRQALDWVARENDAAGWMPWWPWIRS